VLTSTATTIAKGDLHDPDQIEMIYWFTDQPDQPERFNYYSAAYKEDDIDLHNLISAINQKSDLIFPLTPEVKHCLFCIYRSLCNRGVKPGELDQLDDWQEPRPSSEDVSFEYEHIQEIEF
jgi:hypothetical protein